MPQHPLPFTDPAPRQLAGDVCAYTLIRPVYRTGYVCG